MNVHVGVVIPARDEGALIGRCLESVHFAALDALARSGARVTVVVVADGCTDGTVAIARGFDGVVVHEVTVANVGIARAVGCALAIGAGCSWLAHTDADSVVPPNWISEQQQLAAVGHDVVIGTVRPDFDDLSPAHVRQWHDTHEPGRPNGHVHGANLGIRASTYRAVGGFHPLAEHEDNELVVRLMAAEASIIATDAAEVMTSGRTQGRTAGGYAGHLRAIAEQLARESRAVRV